MSNPFAYHDFLPILTRLPSLHLLRNFIQMPRCLVNPPFSQSLQLSPGWFVFIPTPALESLTLSNLQPTSSTPSLSGRAGPQVMTPHSVRQPWPLSLVPTPYPGAEWDWPVGPGPEVPLLKKEAKDRALVFLKLDFTVESPRQL